MPLVRILLILIDDLDLLLWNDILAISKDLGAHWNRAFTVDITLRVKVYQFKMLLFNVCLEVFFKLF